MAQTRKLTDEKTLHWFGLDMIRIRMGVNLLMWVCVCNGRKILELKNSVYGDFPKWGDVYLPGVLRLQWFKAHD